MLSRVERDVFQYFGQQEFFQRFGRWVKYSDGASVLVDVVVLAGFWDWDNYRFVPCLCICPVEINRLRMLVSDGTRSQPFSHVV